MEKYRLIIAKENAEYCKALETYLAATGIFDILPSVFDGSDVPSRLIKDRPDILIIDAILPRLDGIGVIRELRAQEGGDKVSVIVLSSFIDDRMTELLQRLNVAYIIHMPAEMNMILSRILDFCVKNDEISAHHDMMRQREWSVARDEIIVKYLRAIGVPVNLGGYRFVKTAIAYCVDHYSEKQWFTTDVYKYVASVYDTTAIRVERNIRTAIETTWERGDISWQHKLFGRTVNHMKGSPTNKEFIALLADRTALRMRQL